jgi:hypothetical protein
MIRAAFTALGFTLSLWGAGLFYVESVTLKPNVSQSSLLSLFTTSEGSSQQIVFAAWIPHTLIGVGIVTILYAIALPQKARAEKH